MSLTVYPGSSSPVKSRGQQFFPRVDFVAPQPPGRRSTLPQQLRLGPAGQGDHLSIHHFLVSNFHGPSLAEFQAQTEDPFYKPADRLVVKRGDQVVAHARLSNREMFFGAASLPITIVSDLATMPEYRGRGCATAILEAANAKMFEDGAVLGMLRTSIPQFYLSRGWTVCGRHCFSLAKPRDYLAYLSATESTRNKFTNHPLTELMGLDTPPRKFNIRLWRHVEYAALIQLFDENMKGSFGATCRGQEYWHWLISRHGYDRIYVAIDGPAGFDVDESLVQIVGYAAIKDGRIVELMASPHHPGVPSQLLARACGDAIERGLHMVRFDGPPGDPLHRMIELAGGEHHFHEAENGEVFMVRLFDPLGFLTSLYPQLHERAKAAELSRPCELGLVVDNEKYRLVISRRGVKLVSGKLGRSYITCTRSQLIQLLLGHLNVQDTANRGRLEATTQVAIEIASMLFPNLPLWRPPLEELAA